MITICLGNVGSGKTATAIKYMMDNPDKLFYTNINVYGKGTKHIHKIKPEHIIKKEVVRVDKNGKEIYEQKFNKEYWYSVVQKHKMLNVIIDEAHVFFNPRRSMSKINIIMSDFLSLLRRIVGGVDGEKGELLLITQLSRRLDVIAKEMSTHVYYCVNHHTRMCKTCGIAINTHNEQAEPQVQCHICGKKLQLLKQNIEQIHFKNVDQFGKWYEFGSKSYYKRIVITDIEKYFKHYDTLQWEDFFSDF